MAKILRNIDKIIDTQGNELSVANPVEIPEIPEIPPPVLSFRNKIINGDMRIVQRDNLPYAGTAGGYTFDRWTLRKSTGNNNPISKLDEQEVLDLGKVSVLKVENFADSAWIGQRMESSSVLPLANKTVTVSFYAKADTNTSGFRVFLHEKDFNDTHGYPAFSTDVPITTSWQKFSYSMTIGNLVAVNDNAYLNLGFGQSQTNTTVYLTGIQLEEGEVATPFEHRPYGLELSLCKRYYEVIGTPSATIVDWPAAMYNSTTVFTHVPFSVEKRTVPTINATFTNIFSNAANRTGSAVTYSRNVRTSGVNLYAQPTTGATAGHSALVYFHLSADAEL